VGEKFKKVYLHNSTQTQFFLPKTPLACFLLEK
jgi:hypothetical protein